MMQRPSPDDDDRIRKDGDDADHEDDDDDKALRWWWNSLLRETQAVSLWSCCSFLLRVLIVSLSLMQSKTSQLELSDSDATFLKLKNGPMPVVLVLSTLSTLSRWILAVMPSKLLSVFDSPGFIFSNPAILFWVRDKTMVIPNIPIRTCEYMMGRMRYVNVMMK
jgi:hypothetical protein